MGNTDVIIDLNATFEVPNINGKNLKGAKVSTGFGNVMLHVSMPS